MEIVQFSFHLLPPSGGKSQAIRYTAEFLNADGERITLTRDTEVEIALLREPTNVALLLSHVLEDFMKKISAG